MRTLLIFATFLLVTYSIVRIKIEKSNRKIGKGLIRHQQNFQPDECSEPVQRRHRRLFSWAKEEPLRNIRNELWTGDVSVDILKKPFKINFDTGSTTFWVACDCVNDPKNTCAGHTTILDCKNSPICTKTSVEYCAEYADMSMATGFWVKDRVCIDHLCTNNEQWIGCANSTTVGTDEAATGDGIMGLAYNDGSMKWSPLQQIFRKPECDEKVFAFYLDSEAENRQDKSEMTICGIDPNHYIGKLEWFKVKPYSDEESTNYFWMINVTSVLINGEKVWSGDGNMFLDTGSESSQLPTVAMRRMKELISSTSDPKNYPKITYIIDGTHHFHVPSAAYCEDYSAKHCGMGLFAEKDAENLEFGVLGDTFLRANYAVFDPIKGRIGLAPSA